MRATFKLREMFIGADVCFLHDVFAFRVVAKDTAYCAINALIVAAHEEFEENQVAFEDTTNDLLRPPSPLSEPFLSMGTAGS